MRILVTITLILISFSIQAQITEIKPANNNAKDTVVDFKNQGEQEDHEAKQLFEKHHNKEHFKRFKGNVIVNKDSYSYDGKVFEIYDLDSSFKPIFSEGILYPAMMDSSQPPFKRNKAMKLLNKIAVSDTLFAKTLKEMYKWFENNPLIISNFEEFKFLDSSCKQKKFRFWLNEKHQLNPQVFLIELTNKHATDKTDLKTFIDGSVLTFFKPAWIII